MMGPRSRCCLIAIDAVDPDNFVLIKAAAALYGELNVLGVLLTGRPANLQATPETALDDWEMADAIQVQQVAAARIQVFLEACELDIAIYDGGVAPYTQIPHDQHFDDVNGFQDLGDESAPEASALKPLDSLIEEIGGQFFDLLLGGPMTGVMALLTSKPALTEQMEHFIAMYGALGRVSLMDFQGQLRGSKQFNVACDPAAGKAVLEMLTCPMYLITSDCTRDAGAGFDSPRTLASFLPNDKGNRHLLHLYRIWYDAVLKPHKEPIFIHDAAPVLFAAVEDQNLFKVEKVRLSRFPYLPEERQHWGLMEFTEEPESELHVVTEILDTAEYLERFRNLMQ